MSELKRFDVSEYDSRITIEYREDGDYYDADEVDEIIKAHEATIAELQEENKNLEDKIDKLFNWKDNARALDDIFNPPDSKPKLLDHNTSEDCWCEPEEVSDGVFVHKDRH